MYLKTNVFNMFCETALNWMLLVDLTDDKSTLFQVMAWCRQATSHYLNQCQPGVGLLKLRSLISP